MSKLFSRSRGQQVFVLALLFAVAGCDPVGWLPDSSGFVYTRGKDKKQLLLFDVATKKSRLLVANAGGPSWPAVSPDGKRIAIAYYSCRNKKLFLQVTIYDRTGKLVHRVKEIERGSGDGLDSTVLPIVAWAPKGDKLLLGEFDGARLYDLKKEKMVPIKGLLIPFGSGLIRPDGKGAVLLVGRQFYWLPWESKAQPIKTSWAKDELSQGDEVGLPFCTVFFDSGWIGPVARLDMARLNVRVDTAKLSASVHYNSAAERKGEGIRQRHVFPDGTLVRVVGPDGNFWDFGQPARLEVVRTGAEKPAVLVTDAHFKFFPSPDGKLLAVRWAKDTSDPAKKRNPKRPLEEDRILLLGARGATVADLKVGE